MNIFVDRQVEFEGGESSIGSNFRHGWLSARDAVY